MPKAFLGSALWSRYRNKEPILPTRSRIINDAFVLYNLFHYKINNLKNNYKVGFPLSKLNQNIEYLSNKHINYIIIDNKNIVTKNKFKHNNYSKYMIDINTYNRINHIIDKLKSTNYNDLNTLLPRFEALLHDK